MHQIASALFMEKYLKDYLKNIRMEGEYFAKDIECEICNCSSNTTIGNIINIGKNSYGKLPVVACNACGFLFQSSRFDKRFYQDYYANHYRNVIFGTPNPSQEFISDQIKRGKFLYNFLENYFSLKKGSILDVGSSVGGMMKAFIDKGWDALGTDPDIGFVRYGKEKLGLPVVSVEAESMQLQSEKYDLIIIMGSLEHVYDPNKTLELCRAASRPGALLMLEGRGHPQSDSKNYFNHNHHRYFSLNSIQLMMMKHGWQPLETTDEPVCGPTRPGGIYCLGKLSQKPSFDNFLEIIDSGKREYPNEIKRKFDLLDEKMCEV